MRRFPSIGVLAVALLVLGANLSAATFRAGSWPLDVAVAPDKPAIILGEPTWLSFTVRNLSDEALLLLVGGDYQNDLGRPSSFQVKTVRSDGKWVSQPNVGTNEGGLIRPKDLPPGGMYVFRLFMPHWATFAERGMYTIVGTRTLQLLRATDGDFRQQTTTDVVVDARASLEVQAPDDVRMGALVREFGETMVTAGGEATGDDAVLALAWINDPRVVPYFRRALGIRSYALRFIAVQAFAKYSTDDAVEGLNTVLKMGPNDFDHAPAENRPQLAAKLRAAAAGALTRSPHPRARELLVAQRHDESETVRLTVVHALARMRSNQALPLLQEMSRDRSPRVSEEARGYVLRLRSTTATSEAKPR